MKGHKFKKQNCSEKGANAPEVSSRLLIVPMYGKGRSASGSSVQPFVTQACCGLFGGE
jgi:hypothetical protein